MIFEFTYTRIYLYMYRYIYISVIFIWYQYLSHKYDVHRGTLIFSNIRFQSNPLLVKHFERKKHAQQAGTGNEVDCPLKIVWITLTYLPSTQAPLKPKESQKKCHTHLFVAKVNRPSPRICWISFCCIPPFVAPAPITRLLFLLYLAIRIWEVKFPNNFFRMCFLVEKRNFNGKLCKMMLVLFTG